VLEKLLQILNGEKNNQSDNEALVKVATFFYKIDGRISIEEQDYMSKLKNDIEWQSNLDIDNFHQRIISEINQVIDGPSSKYNDYLAKVMDSIESKAVIERAKQIAQTISDADGEIADAEVKSLDFISTY
jgi:tellurite resistance protein